MDIFNLMLHYLESRLDVMVKRLHFSSTIYKSRGIIKAGVMYINTKLIKLPSHVVKFFDTLMLARRWHKFARKEIKLSYLRGSLYSMYSQSIELSFKIFYAIKYGKFKYRQVFYPFKMRDKRDGVIYFGNRCT